MNIDYISPEMLDAEQVAKEKFRASIAQKNELAVEAGSIAIGVAKRIRKVNRSNALKFRAGSGFTQWNASGLPMPLDVGDENITRFITSSHKTEGSLGLRGWSREMVIDAANQEPIIVVNDFELSVNNTAHHPHFGRPYIDFIPADMKTFDNDPERLMQSYDTAAANQLASAGHILNLVNEAHEIVFA